MWSTCKGWTIFQHTLMHQNESNEKNNEQQWMKLKNVFSSKQANGKWRWTARASNSKLYNFQTENGGISTQLKRFYQETPEGFKILHSRIPGPNTMISPSFVASRDTANVSPDPLLVMVLSFVTVHGAHGFENEFPDIFSPKWRKIIW